MIRESIGLAENEALRPGMLNYNPYGITECEVHGLSAILPICEHLSNDAELGKKPDRIVAIWATLFGPSEIAGTGFLACDDCITKMSAPAESSLITIDEMDKIDLSDITGICAACFDEFLTRVSVDWREFMPAETLL